MLVCSERSRKVGFMYRTRLTEWKAELEAELRRPVTWEQIARDTGLSYNTLQKHKGHVYARPDFDVARRIADWFNANSRLRMKSPLDYFVFVDGNEDTAEGQPAGEVAA